MKSTTQVSGSELSGHPLHGIHAATLCPLDGNGRVLEEVLATHVSRVAETPGIRGLLINGHAGEGGLLTPEERLTVLKTVIASVPVGCHVCAGVAGESTTVAVQSAIAAAEQGADSMLVFPPNAWALGQDTDMVRMHHQAISDACGLPMVLYRAPLAAGRQSYSISTLNSLMEIDAVIAIKEGSWEVSAYEEAQRAVMAVRPDIAVLGSGDEHLMTSYAIGSAGSQVSLAAIVPSLIVSLFDVMRGNDLATARQLHGLVYPLSEAIYRRSPSYKATARLKTCLKILGQFPNDIVKGPMLCSDETERAALVSVLGRSEYAQYL
ncbi:MAG: dihydrodipicolinate synthase family protein [Granulosicoccus sp.]